MKAVIRRIDRLEERLAPEPEEEPSLVIVSRVDRELALEKNACIQILRECGPIHGGSTRVVKFSDIPDGLSAAELEKLLRRNGAKIAPVPREPF
jgi:hypothetical protein